MEYSRSSFGTAFRKAGAGAEWQNDLSETFTLEGL
jgi:hypothetical protein